jgi:hypothetical protein
VGQQQHLAKRQYVSVIAGKKVLSALTGTVSQNQYQLRLVKGNGEGFSLIEHVVVLIHRDTASLPLPVVPVRGLSVWEPFSDAKDKYVVTV